ncbi:MAG: endo-1,4-beta-xylanase [Candidatus Binatia bacterium]|nr:endo-1,4-beta-xylanase [Candidatus Binatia bacterium]
MERSLLVVLLTLGAMASAVGAAEPPEVVCAARKIAAAARACRSVLAAESRFISDHDAARRDTRLAEAFSRLERAWNAAEALDGSGRCAATTAELDALWQRLAAAVSAGASDLPASDVCRSRLLAALAGNCARAVLSERAFVRRRAGALEARRRVVARTQLRLARTFPLQCAGLATPQEAAEVLFRIAGGVIGEATSRSLRNLGDEIGMFIGAAVEPEEVAADASHAWLLQRELNSLTAENAMKWEPIHPLPSVYSFAAADAVVPLADAIGARLRGHTLVWGGDAATPLRRKCADG